MERVYFDANIEIYGEINGQEPFVSIVAPLWIVVTGSNRLIALNGNAAKQWPRAGQDSNFGDDGKNGQMGIQGTNAGSFFGIYSKIENGKYLTISANWGNGGNGQGWKAINDYKSWFIAHNSEVQKVFSAELDSTPAVLEIITTHAYLNEAEKMEQTEVEKKKLYQDYYQQFLERIGKKIMSRHYDKYFVRRG